MLLGIGPDGHIASLFPNRSQTAAKKGWVLPVSDSPKPPPERITLTLPVINAAKEVQILHSCHSHEQLLLLIVTLTNN